MGDAAARIELVDGGNGCGLGARCRAKANLARIGKGELSVEEHGVHALADAQDGVLPAKALGNLLLARNAVAQRGDERIGPHDALHSLERHIESSRLDRENDQIGGRCFTDAHGLECAGLAVDRKGVACVTLETGVIHDVFDGVVAERPGDHAAVEQADAALADKGNLVDLHVNHLLTKRRPRAGRLVDCMPLEHVACTGGGI